MKDKKKNQKTPKAIKEDARPSDEIAQDDVENQISSPNLDENGLPNGKAIKSHKQAHAIAKNLVDAAKTGRLATAGIIRDNYDGKAPFDKKTLEAAGQSWRSNFSTNFLASLVDRIVPQLKWPIENATYLTYATLPETFEDSVERSRVFRAAITSVIRSWSAWTDFLQLLIQESVLFGYASPGRVDNDWRPRLFRADEAYFPDGTGQHASGVQIVVFRQSLMIHDFIDILKDKEAAEAAGYDMEGCIKAANKSVGNQQDTIDKSKIEEADEVRDTGLVGSGYTKKVASVNLYHVLVREYDGGVDCWTVQQEDGYAIRHVEKLHESAEDATTLFTIQTGNGHFYGSKGVGRMITNLHIAIERLRCLGADQAYLAGLLILKSKSGNFNRLSFKVRHPFIVMDEDLTLEKERIEFNAEEFRVLVADLAKIAESISGAFVPTNIQERNVANTKIEAAQNAERELAVKQGVEGRIYGNVASLVECMTRAICSPENISEAIRKHEKSLKKKEKDSAVRVSKKAHDLLKKVSGFDIKTIESEEDSKIADPDAVSAIMTMLSKGLKVEEIALLATSPAGNNLKDENEESDAALVQMGDQLAANPYVNQRVRTEMTLKATLGSERASELLIQDSEDPNVEAIATRQQMFEIAIMISGDAVPVASTDNHDIHTKVIYEKIQVLGRGFEASPTMELGQAIILMAQHMRDHAIANLQITEGQREEVVNEAESIIKQMEGFLKMLQAEQEKIQQQEQQAAQQSQQAPQQDPTMMLENAAKVAEMRIKTSQAQTEKRRLELEERKQNHKEEMDLVMAHANITEKTAQIAKESRKEGIEEADRDREAEMTGVSENNV